MSTFFFFLPFILTFTVVAVYAERKIAAFIQDRMGPTEVGYLGLAQTVADLLKLLQKEDIVPKAADRKLFLIAPVIIFTAIFAGFSIIPLSSGFAGAQVQVGVFYLLAVVSLDVIGILIAGWGSNSKFSLFGAIRSVAQIISYEIPLGLTILCVVMISQSFDLQEISFQQGIWWTTIATQEHNYLFGLKSLGIDVTDIGGILTWNIVRMPFFFLVFVIFFITLAGRKQPCSF